MWDRVCVQLSRSTRRASIFAQTAMARNAVAPLFVFVSLVALSPWSALASSAPEPRSWHHRHADLPAAFEWFSDSAAEVRQLPHSLQRSLVLCYAVSCLVFCGATTRLLMPP